MVTATTDAMDLAASSGKWDVLRFLHANRSEGCTTRTMDAAVVQGRLDYVKFLHKNRTEGCSSQALVHAAGSGSLSLVKYLFKMSSSGYGCVLPAMDTAARHGHLEIVMFLHERHDSDPCIDCVIPTDARAATSFDPVVRVPHAFTRVIEQRHFKVLHFLFDHYPSRFGPELLHDLLLFGACDLWIKVRESLHLQLDTGDDDVILSSVLRDAGKFLKMNAIRFIVDNLGRQDLAHCAVDGAAETCHWEHASWLRAVISVAGTQSCRVSAIDTAIACMHEWNGVANLQYLIRQCCDHGAREHAIALAKTRGLHGIANRLESWQPRYDEVDTKVEIEFPSLHPFLLDPRTPDWAVRIALGEIDYCEDPHGRCSLPLTLACRAVLHNDPVMLDVIQDLVIGSTASTPSVCFADDPSFSFDGARAAAIRQGSLEMLQWLLKNVVGLPVEPTLLCEAVQFKRYEIAQWLIVNCPDGCQDMSWDWLIAANDSWQSVDEDLLDWIDQTSTVVCGVLQRSGLERCARALGDWGVLKRIHANQTK